MSQGLLKFTYRTSNFLLTIKIYCGKIHLLNICDLRYRYLTLLFQLSHAVLPKDLFSDRSNNKTVCENILLLLSFYHIRILIMNVEEAIQIISDNLRGWGGVAKVSLELFLISNFITSVADSMKCCFLCFPIFAD